MLTYFTLLASVYILISVWAAAFICDVNPFHKKGSRHEKH